MVSAKLVIVACLLLAIQTTQTANFYPKITEIDICILECDYCFEEQELVQCANDCIRTDGISSPRWKVVCPKMDPPFVKQI